MANIIIGKNEFHDNANIFGVYNEYQLGGMDLKQELAAIKAKVAAGSPEYQAVDTLEQAAKHGSWQSFRQAVAQYAAVFSTTTFANLASAGLLALINGIAGR